MRKITVALVVLLALCVVGRPANAQEAEISINLVDIGYGDVRLEGLYGSSSIYVPLQSNLDLQNTGVEATLVYQTSPLLLPNITTLTVIVDNLPVTSIQLLTDGDVHAVSFDVPTDFFEWSTDGFTVRLEGHLPIDDDICPEIDDPSQWLIILEETTFTFTPVISQEPPTLNDLPQSIMVHNVMEEAPPVVFVMPPVIDPTTLTAAARVAARLGREGTTRDLQPIQVATSLVETANLVVLGTPEDLPLIRAISGAFPAVLGSEGFIAADGVTVPPEHGVIQTFNAPWDERLNVLLVSGGNPEGLQLAGEAFAHTPTYASLAESYRFVSALEPVEELDTNPPWSTPGTTFAQLGFDDRNVIGMGTHEVYYAFQLPPGWELLPGSQLTLRITASPALNQELTHVAVFINEVSVGVLPVGGSEDEITATFNLPVEAINRAPDGSRSQQMVVRLSVGNYLEEQACEIVPQNAAWMLIASSSAFSIEFELVDLPDLQVFPYPFESEAPTVIVLPSEPSAQEVEHALALAAMLGRYTAADFDLRVITGDEATEAALSDAHLILLGATDRNPLIRTFEEMAGGIEGTGLYEALEEVDTGLIREIVSPWNEERVALLVTGVTDEGVANAVRGLLDAVPPVNRASLAAVVEAGMAPRIIFPLEEIIEEEFVVDEAGEPEAEIEPTPQPTATPVEGEAPAPEGTGAETPISAPLWAFIVVLSLAVLALPLALWLSRRKP